MRIIIVLLFLGITFVAKAQKKEFKEELEPFVLANHSVLDYAIGDINNDQLEDAIIIFKRLGEDTIPIGDNAFFNDPIPRPMILLLRDTFGSLYEARRIDHFMECRSCGDEDSEQLASLTIKNNKITFIFKSGKANRIFKETLHYQWKAKESNWYLSGFHVSQHFTVKPDNETDYNFIIKQDEFLQPITIDDDPFFAVRGSKTYNNKISINIRKTYFYDSPNINSQPNGKYLIKGDRASPLIETKHFIWIMYIHPKTMKITRGFILKKGISVAVRTPYKNLFSN